jgi:hypothetical protein
MSCEKDDPRRVSSQVKKGSLRAAHRFLGGSEAAVSQSPGESHADRSTREGRALWRWAKEAARCLNPEEWLPLFEESQEGGLEHRVWYSNRVGRYYKTIHAGRYGWYAAEVVPIDLVMVRAADAMHDYLCRRIDAAKP